MVMKMKDIYEALEFKRVLENVQKYCHTDIGKEHVLNLKLLTNKAKLFDELAILNELSSLIQKYGLLPITSSSSLKQMIEFAKKGGVLTPLELQHVANDVITISSIIKFVENIENLYPKLKEIIAQFYNLSNIERAINQVISPNLTIYDNATSELKKIRHSLSQLESDLQKQIKILLKTYDSLLTDKNITIRNGHFVLPIKTGDKNKVPGIICDVSDTGMTTFIEPNLIVEMNNKIYLLKQQEQEEIMRILTMLTKEVVKVEKEVLTNNTILGYLDFVMAKAQYGVSNDATIASISEEQVIDIKRAYHPLISKDKCIPNDFYLDEKQHILLISGPNAGGKSVALKTVGLAVLMHQSGLPVLALEGAKLGFFKRIYIDIGDQQSLSDSLSTFSAHMYNIVDLSYKLGSKDLVILDELGTGTNPLEGEALAKSVIEHIHSRCALSFITSHFSGVKTFALENNYIINASMIFDETNIAPTYKMRVGVPGKSYGLLVAERTGIASNIIQRAKYFMENSDVNLEATIDRLQLLMQQNEEKEKKLKQREITISENEKTIAKLEKELKQKKASLLADFNQEKEDLLSQTREQIDEILQSINKQDVKMHEVIKAKKDIDDLSEDEEEEEIIDDTPLKVGDYCLIYDLDIEGTIIRKNTSRAIVKTSSGNIETSLKSLVHAVKPKKKNQSVAIHQIDDTIMKRSVPLELNIIGKHIDEGIEELSIYLDQVVIKNFKQVRIIHGSGTGALRTAVHDYLRKQKFVDSFRLGGQNEGGVGATVVYLK